MLAVRFRILARGEGDSERLLGLPTLGQFRDHPPPLRHGDTLGQMALRILHHSAVYHAPGNIVFNSRAKQFPLRKTCQSGLFVRSKSLFASPAWPD